MAVNGTDEGGTRRNSNSPDLWIPYILIGVSCVTFLAVHFWCYHKRNRERYVRKRDETRVKSGLLERRKITTLMIARYQSDLGINAREKEPDLTQTFYDNSVDVIFDESGTHSSKEGNDKSRPPASAAPTAGSGTLRDKTSPGDHLCSKSITSSQTWPLASEKKNIPYNAHTGCSNENRTAKCDTLEHINNRSKNTDNRIQELTSTDHKQEALTNDNSMIISASHTPPNKGNDAKTLPTPRSKSVNISMSPTCVLKHSSAHTSYPGVLYTNLNSPNTDHSSLFTMLREKHKSKGSVDAERAFVGGEKDEISESSSSKPELSRLWISDNGCSNPYTIYGSGNNSINFMYNNSLQGLQKTAEPLSVGSTNDESSPFLEAGNLYGSISTSNYSDSESVRMIPLSEIHRNCPHYREDICRLHGQNSSESQENFAWELQSDDFTDFMTDGERTSNTDIPVHHSCHSPVTSSVVEKSHSSISSKNPEKIGSSSQQKHF